MKLCNSTHTINMQTALSTPSQSGTAAFSVSSSRKWSSAKCSSIFLQQKNLLRNRTTTITRLRSSRNVCLWMKANKTSFIIRAADENSGSSSGKDDEDKNDNDADKSFWKSSYLMRAGEFVEKMYKNFEEDVKGELGLDIKSWRIASSTAIQKFRFEIWPRFVAWNRLEYWKDLKSWELKRIGALVLYTAGIVVALQGLHLGWQRRHLNQRTTGKLVEAYLEALIPEPTPSNLRRLKKALWRKYMPEGFKVKKYQRGPDGTYHLSKSYVGQDAWEHDPEEPTFLSESAGVQHLDFSENSEEPKTQLSLEGDQESKKAAVKETWQERLAKWQRILQKDMVEEDIDSLSSEYVVVFDWKEIKENFQKDQAEKRQNLRRQRGDWISKRWWQYRPRLPYTYFLQKVESLEVEAAVFTEDLRKVYVTMKEGFPSEYIVDLPVDPYIFELLERCGVETDTFIRSILYYCVRGCIVIAPALIFMWYLSHIANVVRLTNGLFFPRFFSTRGVSPHKLKRAKDRELAGYGNAIYGPDVWILLDELMIFMENAEELHARGAKIPKGVLISGPPGTGKTHLVLTMAKASGFPVFFASGADLSDPFYGVKWIGELFCEARKWGPAFIFIDEIDALAGKNISQDPMRKGAFDQLLNELDNDVESRLVDSQQFSSHGVMAFFATNRPEELDKNFVQSGYVDREVHIGFPGEKERLAIFSVHSKNRPLAKDVDFRKVVFRTPGFTGADIRSLINDASVVAARKGRKVICQQDIVEALDKELFENCGILLTDEEQRSFEENVPIENKKLLAVHEAGHILLAHLFPQFDIHAFSFLFAGGQEEALSIYYPREEMLQRGYPTVGYLKMQMVVAHGGRCAEKLLLSDISDEGYDDLAAISKIARELVVSPSNPRLGLLPLTWNGKFRAPFETAYDDPDEGLTKNEWRNASAKAQMSVELSELFTREVTRYIEETEDMALTALQNNRDILEALVAELMQKSKLSGEEVNNIVKSLDPVMMADLMYIPKLDLDNADVTVPPNFRGRYKDLNIYPAPLHRC